jgi:predicted RNA-binding protein (virulence factor B family)
MTPIAGSYHTLSVVKLVDFGAYLDGGEHGEILLPKRFAPKGLKAGDELEVFIYHDSDNKLIATTQKPFAQVGDIQVMDVVDTNRQGAFLDWGLMKDLFLPLSQQRSVLYKGMRIPVYVYLDKQTGRVAATEKFNQYLDNETLTVQENEEVDLLVSRETELGYEVFVNNKHIGLMYFSDVFGDMAIGDRLKGFVKRILEDNKLDIMPGERGYKRIESEVEKVWRMLQEHDGYLPYNDKSAPEEIYTYFGMSKKAFKMATGALYKQKKISFTQTGIRVEEQE